MAASTMSIKTATATSIPLEAKAPWTPLSLKSAPTCCATTSPLLTILQRGWKIKSAPANLLVNAFTNRKQEIESLKWRMSLPVASIRLQKLLVSRAPISKRKLADAVHARRDVQG